MILGLGVEPAVYSRGERATARDRSTAAPEAHLADEGNGDGGALGEGDSGDAADDGEDACVGAPCYQLTHLSAVALGCAAIAASVVLHRRRGRELLKMQRDAAVAAVAPIN